LEEINFEVERNSDIIESICPEADKIMTHHFKRALALGSNYANQSLIPDFAFVRRYSQKTRKFFSLHLDDNIVSVIVPLNPRVEYEGGELYMYPQSWTERNYDKNMQYWSWDDKEE